MKRQRVVDDDTPPPSLFPHEIRARTIVAFLCIWRHRRQEQPMLAMVPRDVVRMICNRVNADFREATSIGYFFRDFPTQASIVKLTIWDYHFIRFAWVKTESTGGLLGIGSPACPKCLGTDGGDIYWRCQCKSSSYYSAHNSRLWALSKTDFEMAQRKFNLPPDLVYPKKVKK